LRSPGLFGPRSTKRRRRCRLVFGFVYDQSELIDHALTSVQRAILIGAVLVVIVLLLLLGDVRPAVIVTVTLPTSVILAGMVMYWFGAGINTMTLGGLAIAVGILVDAAIIMTENIHHRLSTAQGDLAHEPPYHPACRRRYTERWVLEDRRTYRFLLFSQRATGDRMSRVPAV
jgi:hypothetical protein